jgi:hypothetical protein
MTRQIRRCDTPYSWLRKSAAALCWFGLTTFFCDVLEHLLVEHQLGHQPLEPIDLGLQLAAPAVVVDLGRVMSLPPPVIGGLGHADLPTDVGDGQALGQVAIDFAKHLGHLVGGPSFPHDESLRDSVYRGTPISTGPVLGEQTSEGA